MQSAAQIDRFHASHERATLCEPRVRVAPSLVEKPAWQTEEQLEIIEYKAQLLAHVAITLLGGNRDLLEELCVAAQECNALPRINPREGEGVLL